MKAKKANDAKRSLRRPFLRELFRDNKLNLAMTVIAAVLEALAMAHDMTIYGRRDNVMVFREQDGKRQMFVLDLTDTAFMDSPAFYLQQNDMVYVTPNKVRAGQSTINQNNVKSVGFWVTIGNVALTAANFIATLSR